VTGALHFQVLPCAIQELLIDTLPDRTSHDGAFYPDGARFTDLKEVRDLLYKKQRPAITPNVRPSCFYIFFPPLIPVPSCLRLAFSSWCTRTIGKKGTSSCSIGRWRVQAGPSSRVLSVQPCRV
jgi:hypothetical protein